MAKAKKSTKKVPQRAPKVHHRFYYKNDEWRWQIKVGGIITAASTEGYTHESECRENYFNTCINMLNNINMFLFPKRAKLLEKINEQLKKEYLEDFKTGIAN